PGRRHPRRRGPTDRGSGAHSPLPDPERTPPGCGPARKQGRAGQVAIATSGPSPPCIRAEDRLLDRADNPGKSGTVERGAWPPSGGGSPVGAEEPRDPVAEHHAPG